MADDPTPARRRRARAGTPAEPAGDALTAAAPVPAANSILGSAKVLTQAKKGAVPKPAEWQDEAWGYYDTLGELRFACSWYANALSRCRLTLALRGAPGDDPTPLDEGDPRLALLDDLGSTEGQAQLLAAFAPHLTVPGIAYLVGVDVVDAASGEVLDREWRVLSSDELRAQSGKFQTVDETGKWVDLGDDALPVKVWRAHARRRFQPDSPVRALLPVLRELSLLAAHIDASATSRLAGAGILLMAKEVTFPVKPENEGKEDPFTAELMDAMLTPIGDRSAASAMVPYVVRVPGEYVDKIKHLTFATSFDDKTIDLREEARGRFAAGMDMPAEVLLGLADSNHWTAWQIEESAVKLHVVPMLGTIVDGLTVGWLRPTIAADPTLDDDPALVVWYDTSGLTVRPDRSGDAKDLYGVQAIGLAALLRACGFDDSDKPTDDELTRALLIDLVKGAPTLFPVIAPMLGLTVKVPEGVAPLDDGSGAPAGGAPAPAPTSTGPAPIPDTQADPPPTDGAPDALPAAARAGGDLAVVEACDGLVWRALERAGNRLRNLGRAAGTDLSTVAPEFAHTQVDPTCLSDLDGLLDGAWERVPAVAERHGIDPEALTSTLDRYARSLLAARVPHAFDRLADVLGADLPPVAPPGR